MASSVEACVRGWLKRLFVLSFALAPALAAGSDPARVSSAIAGTDGVAITRFTLRFSSPMVALGDPRRPPPASVNCAVAGEGRWIDPATWTWQFARPLPGGAACRVTLRTGLKTLSGAPIAGARDFPIDAGGPIVLAALPAANDSRIEEDQTFLIAVNGPVDRASVAANAYCAVDGIGEQIAVDLLAPDLPAKLLPAIGPRWNVDSFLDRAGIAAPAPGRPRDPRAFADVIALKCRRPLPPGRDVSLVWGAAIRAPGGRTVGHDTRLDYSVREEFTAKLECARVNPRAGCSPVEAATLSFSAPVARAAALAARLDVGGGRTLVPTTEGSDATLSSVTFKPMLPAGVTAHLVLPANMRDASGRPLANARRFPLDVRIDEAPPLVKFAAPFGILEAREGGVLPVTVRGVEPALAGGIKAVGGGVARIDGTDGAVANWLRRVDKAQEADFRQEKHGGATVTVNHTGDTPILGRTAVRGVRLGLPGGGKPFEVVGMPLSKPGFYVVELKSPALGRALLGRDRPRYVAAAALVTNMGVHFKWGRTGSLAWVTALDTGRPVGDARVTVTDSCTGKALASGTTDRWGRFPVLAVLPPPTSGGSCDPDRDEDQSPPLMVSARKGGDFSFVRSDWGQGIQPYDFDLSFGWSAPEPILHVVMDRALVRAGETANMTFVYRRPITRGFGYGGALKGSLKFRHRGSDTSFEQPLTLDAHGMGEAQWTPPRGAPNGDYDISVEVGDKTIATGQSIEVDEYHLPVMRASVSGPKAPRVRARNLPIDLYLGYLSGGGAGGTSVTLRTAFEPMTDAPDGWDDWTFGGKPIAEGTQPLDEDGDVPTPPAPPARTTPLTLGPNGALRTTVALPAMDGDMRAIVEMDYPDANGETLTASARVPLYGASIRLGIKPDGWMQRQGALHLKFVALDTDGKPLANQVVSVQLYTREILSARRRLIGGFYAFDNSAKTTRIAAHCTATTDKQGLAQCALDPKVSGEVYAVATAKDALGNVARAVTSVWLAGDDDWWFGGDNGDRMDIVPDAKSYKAGDVAHVQVRMPFREATGLVTIEREGVMASQVVHLSGKNPVVDVKLEPGYAPDAYISVIAVRGRIAGWRLWLADFARRWHLPFLSQEGASPTALVDLAKPAYRIGIAKVSVGWEAHRLNVAVRADHPTYHVRDTANVMVQVTTPNGRPPASAEIAFAAVDDGLLALAPNDSWGLLDAMEAERPLSVVTATAQTQVVGKRHYGRKAVAAGGGGGGDLSALTRSDFRPVLLWRGRVPLDAQGRARIPVPLADALSSYTLVAIASAGPDRFGTGKTTIRTTQPLAIYPGVPPQVRTGDRYGVTFTLRNGSDRPMRVTAAAQVSPRIGTASPLTVTVPAGGAMPVTWNLNAPNAPGHLQWTVTARSADGRASDAVSVGEEVVPLVPTETWAATLVHADPTARVAVAAPAGALAGRSGVAVALMPTLAPPLDGVRAYMRAYPYGCFEQRLSKAVALDDRAAWAKLAGELPAYQAPDGLVRYFPGDALPGSAVLTAYALSMTAEAGLPVPDGVRAKMLDAMRAVADGRLADDAVGGQDRRLLRVAAIAALARNGASSPGLLAQAGLAPQDMPTSTLADWIAALARTPGADPRLMTAAEGVLRSRIVYEGARLDLVDRDAASPWLMSSGDEMAAKALLAIVGRTGWAAEAPRMAIGLTLRQVRGHWDTTTANAWGTIAARKLAAAAPANGLRGVTTASLARRAVQARWPLAPGAAPLALPLPGGTLPVVLSHAGGPGPWATVSVTAAVPLAQPLFAGYRVARSVSAVEQRHPGRWSTGDIMRVHLVIDAPVDRTWVAVSDPLPAGAAMIGGQPTQSAIVAGKVDVASGTMPTYYDPAIDAFHAYYAELPKGRTTIDYALRLNGAGRFGLPPTTVEALYSPAVHAALPNAALEVGRR